MCDVAREKSSCQQEIVIAYQKRGGEKKNGRSKVCSSSKQAEQQQQSRVNGLRGRRAAARTEGTERDYHNQSTPILKEHHLSSFLTPLILFFSFLPPPSLFHFPCRSSFDLACDDALRSFITFKTLIEGVIKRC